MLKYKKYKKYMDCKVKIKALNGLKDKGVISKNREIIDIVNFNLLNTLYTRHAIEKYGLDTNGQLLFNTNENVINKERGNRLRTGERTILRAEPNSRLFDVLELLVTNYNNDTNQSKVNYQLKAVDILSSDKAKKIFEKGEKNNWDLNKILTELQVPKQQKQIILDKGLENKKGSILTQDNNSYYRGTVTKPKIDSKGNLIIKAKEDSLYKKAGLNSFGVSLGYSLQESFEYGEGQLKRAVQELIDEYDEYGAEEKDLEGFTLIQIDKDAVKDFIKEEGEIKTKGDLIVPKGKYKIEQVHPDFTQEEYNEQGYNEFYQSNLREEIITSLLADNSYTIEINTAKQKEGLVKDGTEFKIGEDYYYSDPIRNVYKIMYSVDNGGGSKDITKQEFEEARQNSKPTQHYSNLTVPGGTNYTENEIATPDITPSIKGHAQFATDNGIGWFRSDNQEINLSLLEQQGIIKKVPC